MSAPSSVPGTPPLSATHFNASLFDSGTQSDSSAKNAALRSSCNVCAASKIKCSKEKPVCNRCVKRGLECTHMLGTCYVYGKGELSWRVQQDTSESGCSAHVKHMLHTCRWYGHLSHGSVKAQGRSRTYIAQAASSLSAGSLSFTITTTQVNLNDTQSTLITTYFHYPILLKLNILKTHNHLTIAVPKLQRCKYIPVSSIRHSLMSLWAAYSNAAYNGMSRLRDSH